MRGRPFGLALWLLVLASTQVIAFIMVWRFFVQSEHGQLLDTVALAANRIGRARSAELVDSVLDTISVLWLAIATGIAGFIALIRRRIAVASGVVLLVAGANVTTQVLKEVITRPELGVDPERATAGNSLPSGHLTVAASVAVALILVLPARLRGVGAMVGAAFTAAVGVATLSAGWHRPSDSAAAALVVGGWACTAGLFVITMQRSRHEVAHGEPNRFTVAALSAAGLVLLAGAALAFELTDKVLSTPPDELSRSRLLVAYAGGAGFIAGTVSLVLASVLATAHLVVPQAVPSRWRRRTAAMVGGHPRSD